MHRGPLLLLGAIIGVVHATPPLPPGDNAEQDDLLTIEIVNNDPDSCQSPEMVQCPNSQSGKCIPRKWLCDGDADCEGGTDELNCDSKECSEEQFTCATAGPTSAHQLDTGSKNPRCIPKRWQCDGEADCADKSDEKDCKVQECTEDQFTCKDQDSRDHSNHFCIPKGWQCDGQHDCHSGEDEEGCGTIEPLKCQASEFPCGGTNGCIFKDWACDFDHDCPDGADEWPKNTNCSAKQSCEDSYFECTSNKYCIPTRWKCDGEPDCQDASDETNEDCDADVKPPVDTHFHAVCGPQEFACKTGGCIHQEWVCDHDPDCPDHSDEELCEHKDSCTGPGLFHCAHKGDPTYGEDWSVCIHRRQLCDGVEDCPHRASGKSFDELEGICKPQDVDFRPDGCSRGEFSCQADGHYCVPFISVCNGKIDCPNKKNLTGDVDESMHADEDPTLCDKAKKDDRSCSLDNGHCEQICRQLAKGVICECNYGFAADSTNASKCIDVNECQLPGACSQVCENKDGHHVCSCHKGYFLQADGRTCRALGPDRPRLLISNRAHIREIDLTTKEYLPLIDDLHSAVAMDFIYKKKMLIWSDVAAETIKMCTVTAEMMDFGLRAKAKSVVSTHCNATTIVKEDISTPDGLAVDWTHNLLFWTDTGHDTISVVNLDDHSHRRTLFNESLDEPRAIAVDPKAGLIFWTDWGQTPKIERAGMDGTDRRVIVSDGLQWPNGLALDLLSQKVYWADAKLKLISSCDYDGKNVRVVLQSMTTLRHPFSLSVFEEKLYWTDWDTEGVHSANKFTGSDAEVIAGGLYGPMTVRVFHSLSQPEMENKCRFHRCEQLCLPRPRQAPAPGAFGAAAGVGDELDRAQFELDSDRALRVSPFVCHCRDGFTLGEDGRSCADRLGVADSLATTTSVLTKFSIALLVVVLLALIALLVYRRGFGRISEPFNFDNPVYRRTVEEEGWEADGNVRIADTRDFHDLPPRKSPEPPPRLQNYVNTY